MNRINKQERQLSFRGVLIGAIGSVIITMSSMFVALKLSSLPWPIIFAALVSMFFLKLLGNTNLHEINVTHTAMSAGAMVAGGLAFTIPGIWMLYPDEKPDIIILLAVALGGTILGLIFTALIRKYFVEEKELEYPMGEAAAETLVAGDEGGVKAVILFISMGVTALFTILRESLKLIPQTIMNKRMLAVGSYTGLYISPMLVGVGYILGPVLMGIWLLGGIIGDFGILLAGEKLVGLSLETATSIKQSLGIGLMVGSGLGIIIKRILPRFKTIISSMGKKEEPAIKTSVVILIMVSLAFVFTYVCKMSVVASIITILGTWLATSMASECVGRSGINPMEIFGIIVLLIAKIFTHVDGSTGFYIAAVVAVAAGLTGDVMNDFKAGYILKTDARAQWIGELVGGLVGAVTAVATLYVIYRAYGDGIGTVEFPAAQAATVASMVGGISNVKAFIIGIVIATILYLIDFPVMTLGLGVYLPFYLTLTASIGGFINLLVSKLGKKENTIENGTLVASGMLGGEAIVGVIISIIIAVQSF